MINVSTSLNRGYVDYACVMLCSLCENASDRIHAYILQCELTEDDKSRMTDVLSPYDIELSFISIDPQRFDERMVRNEMWTVEAYFRLFLPDILPRDVDRILYLDVDVIVNHPIDEFYYIDFQGMDFVATIDNSGLLEAQFHGMRKEKMDPLIKTGHKYFNSGVVLMNMDQIRGEYSFDVYDAAMKEWEYQMFAPDQDILNYVHAGKVLYVDPLKWDAFAIHIFNFDVMDFEEFDEYASIIHYSGPKPWQHKMAHYPFEKIWWRYAKKLSIYDELSTRYLFDMFDDDHIRIAVDTARNERNHWKSEAERLQSKVLELTDALTEMIDMNERLLDSKSAV